MNPFFYLPFSIHNYLNPILHQFIYLPVLENQHTHIYLQS